RGSRRAARRALSRRRAAGGARRAREASRAPLRLAPGRRVGDRARNRKAARPPGPARDGDARAARRLGLGDLARDGRFRRRRPDLMPLSDDDVREILRLIDEAEDEELELETEAYSLYVRQVAEPRAAPPARRKRGGKTVGIVDTTT